MKKFKIKLSIYFAILTTITIVATSVLFAIYLYSSVSNLFGKYQTSVEEILRSLSLTLAQSFKEDVEKHNFDSSKAIVKLLKNDGRIKYMYLVKRTKNGADTLNNSNDSLDDKVSDDIETSTNDTGTKIEILVGNPDEFESDTAKQDGVKQFSKQLMITNTRRSSVEYMIYGGIPVEDVGFNIYDSFAEMVVKLLLAFFLLGALVSYLMANVVSGPLKKVSDAAREITDGNFDIKIEPSKFEEIDNLVYSYNNMTTQLNELYSSLELKVQERTIALEAANYKLKETQAMMVHSEKMRSLGELVAGIAHEINNPVNFIHGNIMILQNYADDLLGLIDLYSEIDGSLPADFKEKVEKLKQDIDLDFLKGDIKDLIKSCIEGTQRTKNIVLDLKNFSRMEEMVLTQFDIPKEIDTTLNILNNKYKNRITVIKNYAPDVPKIEAYGGQLNQVFMNILDNAQDAIEGSGTLTINIRKTINNRVKIEFIDSGKGIEKENIAKVFDPFFTTKPVGKGTGLGMSISYRVIHDHNGTIEVDSEVGKGTKFTIVLPVNHDEKSQDDGLELS